MADFKTIVQIAKEAGVTERRADYAARQRGIEASTRIGIVRLFNPQDTERVKQAITEIAARKEAIHA